MLPVRPTFMFAILRLFPWHSSSTILGFQLLYNILKFLLDFQAFFHDHQLLTIFLDLSFDLLVLETDLSLEVSYLLLDLELVVDRELGLLFDVEVEIVRAGWFSRGWCTGFFGCSGTGLR